MLGARDERRRSGTLIGGERLYGCARGGRKLGHVPQPFAFSAELVLQTRRQPFRGLDERLELGEPALDRSAVAGNPGVEASCRRELQPRSPKLVASPMLG